jgi:pimeloyl-ACP methyl ester carboxylesterase
MEERTISNLAYLAGRWPLDSKKPTLVFIHGAGASSRFWVNQIDALRAGANTVALDLPGHGRSPKPGCDSISAYTRRVVEFVEMLHAPRPVLAGLSMGGAIVQQALLDCPGRFEAAILMNTGAKLKVLPAIFDLLQSDFPGFIELTGTFGFSPKTPRENYEAMLEDTAAQSPEVTYGDFRACDAFDVRSRLPEIKAPVLVITAEDDRLTPPAYGEFLEKGIPGARRVHVADAGHFAPVEKPEEVNRAILEFLSQNGL